MFYKRRRNDWLWTEIRGPTRVHWMRSHAVAATDIGDDLDRSVTCDPRLAVDNEQGVIAVS